MILHYLAVALAKFRKTPFTTAANVLTLALGLAAFLAAYAITVWWSAGDSHHADAERTFIVGQNVTNPGQQASGGLNSYSSATLSRYLQEDFPEIERVVRAMAGGDAAVAAGENKTTVQAAFVDPGFLDVFDFEFLAGDPRRSLDEPGSVILTEEAAAVLFGDEPAVGQSVLVNNSIEAHVTGVIAPVRQPSFMGSEPGEMLAFDMLGNWRTSPASANMDNFEGWAALCCFTFITLEPGASVEAINARFPEFLERRIPPQQQNSDFLLRAYPIADIAKQTMDNLLFAQSGLSVSAVSVLLGLGLLTLAVACVNYANLATAQAATRAKEVGLRKVVGAGRSQVMIQSWLEATLLSIAALLLALASLALAAPVVRAASGVDLLYFLSLGWRPLAGAAGAAVLVAFVAGAYPALALSGVRPADALRSGRSRSGSWLVARVLVAIQFVSASFLLILVTVTQLQRMHVEQLALAHHEDPIVVVDRFRTMGIDYDTFAARVAQVPGVLETSVVDWAPWDSGFNGAWLARSPDPAVRPQSAYVKSVGYDYFSTLDIPLLAGRVFDAEHDTAPVSIYSTDASQTPSIVIDRIQAERLGFATPESAIDQVVWLPESFTQASGRAAQPLRVIGVTEPERTRVEEVGISGHIYVYSHRALFGGQAPIIKIARDNVQGAVQGITAIWDELAPNAPITLSFLDDRFERSFAAYARVAQLFMLLAGSAFAIASIGLLGIAVHVASRRRHEIGVRKTLGSTTLGVFRLLLIDFSKPVLVANLLAWPLGYFAAQAYLSAFAERVPLTPAPFAFSLAITLAIAWAAVIGEVLKAASIRPAEVLRTA